MHAISIGQFPIGHLVAGFTLQPCGPLKKKKRYHTRDTFFPLKEDMLNVFFMFFVSLASLDAFK
jgi:hypothetical protein